MTPFESTKRCAASGCINEVSSGNRFKHCPTCRQARRMEFFAARCRTPGCDTRFMVRAVSLSALRDWPNKFCPACKTNFGGRFKALKLQAEKGLPITQIIVDAGRDAFDACYGSYGRSYGRDVIDRFRRNLGVSRTTLHDWLRFFFGLSWPDWKRRFICSSHECSIVDVAEVAASGRFSKYYAVDKFRKRGICACPIRGDNLVLIDRRPEGLTPEELEEAFSRKLDWFDDLEVVSGSHLPLLEEQEG